MTAVFLRKDTREIAPSALALTLLGIFSLVMVKTFIPAHEADTAALAILGCLAWTCALVTSVQPFAHEVEAGTLNWIDALPATRRAVWQAKAATAGLTSLVQVLALLVAYFSLRLPAHEGGALDVGVALLSGANGWVCGMCGSVLARTALSALILALAAQVSALTLAFIVVFGAFYSVEYEPGVRLEAAVALAALPLPLAVSLRTFTRLDRLRQPTAAIQRTSRKWPVERSLAWLTWQQIRTVSCVVIAIGAVAGWIVPTTCPAVWPIVGYALAGTIGVTAFASDQNGEAFRFLGDRRLPPRRIWLVKLAVACGLVVAAMLPAMLAIITRLVAAKENPQSLRPEAAAQVVRELSSLLAPAVQLLGPLYGFAVGQFFGLTQRKPAVALVLTAATGAALAAALGPSVLVGGFAARQWLFPPIMLFAATAFAMRPWVSGRLATLRPVVGLAAAFCAFGLFVATGLWARATEVPDRVPPFDILAFQRSLPTPEANEAGRRIRSIVVLFVEHVKSVAPNTDPRWTAIYEGMRDERRPIDEVSSEFIKTIAAGEWLKQLSEAVRLPLGRIDTLNAAQTAVDHELVNNLIRMGYLVTVEARRLAAAGQLADAFDRATTAVNLSRQMRSKANGTQFGSAMQTETMVIKELIALIDHPKTTDEQMRNALRLLVENARDTSDATDAVKADYLILANILASGGHFLPQDTSFDRNVRRAAKIAPWEQIRQHRILALEYSGYLRTLSLSYKAAMATFASFQQRHPDVPFIYWQAGADGGEGRIVRWLESTGWADNYASSGWLVAPAEMGGSVRRRAALLQVALKLYERMHGSPAKTLDALVPELIAAVPVDPVDGLPFRYRISMGEELEPREADGPSGPAIQSKLIVGQGVVWSIGPDYIDGGGTQQTYSPHFTYRPTTYVGDIIFPVPEPRKQ